MSNTHTIRSFRDVLRDWKREFPDSSLKEVREYLSCAFALGVAAATDYNGRHGPLKDIDFDDNERVLDEIGVQDIDLRAHALKQMKKLDRLRLKGHAQTTAERVHHVEILVGHLAKIPHFGECTAREFVKAFFYNEQSYNKRIHGWQKFLHVATYWVYTGKPFTALRRAAI